MLKSTVWICIFAAGEQAAATAPAEEPEVVETFQYQYMT